MNDGETIYRQAVAAVKDGAKFRVDLERRDLVIDGKKIIDGGRYEGELFDSKDIRRTPMDDLETLYHTYKHSIPTARSESKRRRYFKALPEKELSDEDMLYGISRDVAQIQLELYVLCMAIKGLFEWPDEAMWFWQSERDKKFVILKKWITDEKQ